jgi:hypothetical protein
MSFVSVKRCASATLAILSAISLTAVPARVCARNQWDINHGMSNPPMDPRFAPGGKFAGYVPAVSGADFWKGQLNQRVPIGTVLTGILEDDLSSKKSKKGDTFTLTLQDGFQLNGNVLIPPNSKIIGSVVSATAARDLRNGNPGRLEVALQTLVFPDGRHMPIFAMIDSNPNHAFKKPPKVRHLGVSLADYGESLAAFGASFLTGPGVLINRRNRGNDFVLDKGDALPIRLNRSLDIPYQPPQLAQPASGRSATIDPSGPIAVPAPLASTAGGTTTQTPASADPNAVFSQPVKPAAISDMPDPF